jgi:hypothetical protein
MTKVEALLHSLNSEKIILDLCGGTGAWSKPYKEAGYDVRVITLPDNDVLTYFPPRQIYGILAAPPCTQFSLARTNANIERNLKKGMETVKACLEIIYKLQYDNKLKFWALENPKGLLRRFLGNPSFIFDPTEFGHNHNKCTYIWGNFTIPLKTHTFKRTYSIAEVNKFEEIPADYKIDNNVRKDAIYRSITPASFAKAFYEANR